MNNNKKIEGLYAALKEQMDNKPPVLAMRTLSLFDRERQGLAATQGRYFISVLDRHIMERAYSVVFVVEVTDDFYLLKLCCPLTAAEYKKLAALKYTPLLRSKYYLTVGLEQSYPHAYSAIRLSPYSSAIDVFDALFLLGRELEAFIIHIDGKQNE